MARQFNCYNLKYLAVCFLLATPALAGGSYTELYNFDCAKDGCNAQAPALLAQGEDGVLYGTLPSGTSQASDGTVMSYTPDGSENTLYRFGGDDGEAPQSGLTLGFDGNFYGTTTNGGIPRVGTIFRLSGGNVSVLYSFNDQNDGAYPWAPPVQTSDGNLYGSTYSGANPGSAYRLTPKGKYTVIASLPSKTLAPFVMADDGNFYGTTQYGGDFNEGTVFRLSTNGKLTILHSFDASTEGVSPIGPVLQALDERFYGTTSVGGKYGQGTVWQLGSNGKLKILHNFQSAEGSGSTSGVVQATNGNLYGVSAAGGSKGFGTLWRINMSGSKFQVLHQFTSKTGTYPGSTPTFATNGVLYGLTTKGGQGENGASGVIYGFTDGFSPCIALQLWYGPVGTQVGILGQGFSTATGVRFGSVAASYTVISDTFLVATVPAGATSDFVAVMEPAGDLGSLKKFKVT